MHFAAWLVGGGLGARSRWATTRTTSSGSLSLLDAMVDAGVAAARLLVHLRGLRRAGDGADRRDARDAADQRLRRDQAGGRACAAAPRARARPALDRAALFQRRRRASRRHDRRGSRPRDPPHSARDRGGDRRACRCRCSARTIRRRTAPACATTSTSAIWRTRTCCALRALAAGGASGSFNVGTGQPHSVKQVIDTVSRVVGAPVRWAPAPRRAGRSRRSCTPRAIALQQRAGLAAATSRDLDTIVRHAWRGTRRIREGYRTPLRRPDGPALPPAALRRPAPGAHRRRDAGDARLRGRIGGAGVSDQADHRRGPSEPDVASVRGRSASSASYFFKGIGGYFSSYLMDDLGHRVVMRFGTICSATC